MASFVSFLEFDSSSNLVPRLAAAHLSGHQVDSAVSKGQQTRLDSASSTWPRHRQESCRATQNREASSSSRQAVLWCKELSKQFCLRTKDRVVFLLGELHCCTHFQVPKPYPLSSFTFRLSDMTSISIQYAWEYLYLNSKHLSFHFLKQHEIKFSLTPRVSPSFLLDLPPFEHLGLAVRITAFTGYLRLRRLAQPNPLAP